MPYYDVTNDNGEIFGSGNNREAAERHAADIPGAYVSMREMPEEEVDALECTLEDEEAAHQGTLRMLEVAQRNTRELAELLREIRDVYFSTETGDMHNRINAILSRLNV